MGPEARGMVLVSAALMAFGLAVLYSASAFVAAAEHKGQSAYFLIKQLQAVAVNQLLDLPHSQSRQRRPREHRVQLPQPGDRLG